MAVYTICFTPSPADPPYLAFKILACEVATILNAEWQVERPAVLQASKQLQQITSGEWEATWFHYGQEKTHSA
jgi:hypothetical protein